MRPGGKNWLITEGGLLRHGVRIEQAVGLVRGHHGLHEVDVLIGLDDFRAALHSVEEHRARLLEVAD